MLISYSANRGVNQFLAGIAIIVNEITRVFRLEALVQQRISNFIYLRKIHEGGRFWLNIVLLNNSDIQRLVQSVVPKQRVVAFYYLGLSLYSLVELKGGATMVRALSQLVEEYEYFCSGAAMQGMKLLLAKNSNCVYPSLMAIDLTEDSLVRPSIFKFQNSVVFERLKTPHVSFELDYVEVVLALSDALSNIYEKLFQTECYS